MKLDLKRLAWVGRKILCYSQYKYLLRQWSGYPVIQPAMRADIFFTLLAITEEVVPKKKWVNPYPRPTDHANILENFLEFDQWILFYYGTFSPEQWGWTVPFMFIIYVFCFNPLYNQIAIWIIATPYLTKKQRAWFVLVDLMLCAFLGAIFLMGHSIFASMIHTCPVVFSPFFILLEFLLFFWILRLRFLLLLVDQPSAAVLGPTIPPVDPKQGYQIQNLTITKDDKDFNLVGKPPNVILPEVLAASRLPREKKIFDAWIKMSNVFGLSGLGLALGLSFLAPKYVAECCALGAVFIMFLLVCWVIYLRFRYLVYTKRWEKYRRIYIPKKKENAVGAKASMFHVIRRDSIYYKTDLERESRYFSLVTPDPFPFRWKDVLPYMWLCLTIQPRTWTLRWRHLLPWIFGTVRYKILLEKKDAWEKEYADWMAKEPERKDALRQQEVRAHNKRENTQTIMKFFAAREAKGENVAASWGGCHKVFHQMVRQRTAEEKEREKKEWEKRIRRIETPEEKEERLKNSQEKALRKGSDYDQEIKVFPY